MTRKGKVLIIIIIIIIIIILINSGDTPESTPGCHP
jgi:hypothetical protein